MNIVLYRIQTWTAERRKALLAFFLPILVTLAARYGLALTDEQITALVVLITSTAVYAAPNQTKG